jgi:hypothetical protein
MCIAKILECQQLQKKISLSDAILIVHSASPDCNVAPYETDISFHRGKMLVKQSTNNPFVNTPKF